MTQKNRKGSSLAQENSLFDQRAFYRKVFYLAVPMALQNLINVGVTAADTIMLGRLSETVLSASSLAGQIQYIMTLFFFGLTAGASVLTAQYWGRRDIKTIEKITSMTISIGFLVSILFACAAFFIPGPLMHLYTNDTAVIQEGITYLRIVALSYVFTGVAMIYLNILKSVERVIISPIVYSISLCLNIAVNAVLIFGLFGAPVLGIRGAAIGTLCARAFEFLFVILYLKLSRNTIKIHLAELFHFDKVLFRDFMKYSIPVTMNEFFWGIATSANTSIIAHISTSAAAANSVAQVCRQLVTVVGFGVSSSAAILLGKTLGEGKKELVVAYSKKFIRLSLIIGTVSGILILVSQPIILATMNFTPQAASYLKFMLFVMFYFTIAQTCNTTIVCGILRSGGDIKFALVMDLCTMWGCSILLGALSAFVFHFDIRVTYFFLMCDELVKIPVCFLRYRKMKWVNEVTQ